MQPLCWSKGRPNRSWRENRSHWNVCTRTRSSTSARSILRCSPRWETQNEWNDFYCWKELDKFLYIAVMQVSAQRSWSLLLWWSCIPIINIFPIIDVKREHDLHHQSCLFPSVHEAMASLLSAVLVPWLWDRGAHDSRPLAHVHPLCEHLVRRLLSLCVQCEKCNHPRQLLPGADDQSPLWVSKDGHCHGNLYFFLLSWEMWIYLAEVSKWTNDQFPIVTWLKKKCTIRNQPALLHTECNPLQKIGMIKICQLVLWQLLVYYFWSCEAF